MTSDDLNEAVAVLQTMMTALQAAVPGAVGRPGAAFRYAAGDLLASAASLLTAGALSAPMLNCFTLANAAGATLPGMDTVRAAMQAQTPVGLPATLVANAGVRFALGQEARILAVTSFTSSQDVFAALDSIADAFDSAQIYAADNHDPSVYQALIALQAAVAQDMTTRAAPLPRLVSYTLAQPTTSHALAYRLYGDTGRCDELRAEGKVIHPAFMPLAGTALSQ